MRDIIGLCGQGDLGSKVVLLVDEYVVLVFGVWLWKKKKKKTTQAWLWPWDGTVVCVDWMLLLGVCFYEGERKG